MERYSYGEVSEYVLDAVVSMIDGLIDMDDFIIRLRRIGMGDQDIMTLYAEEVLGV